MKSFLGNENMYNIDFFNYKLKLKEIVFNVGRFSRAFPKFVKPLSVKFLFLYKHKISNSDKFDNNLLLCNYQ